MEVPALRSESTLLRITAHSHVAVEFGVTAAAVLVIWVLFMSLW